MMHINNKDKESKSFEKFTTFTCKQGFSVIWRLFAYGLSFDIFLFLILIPVVFIMLIFDPDRLLNAFDILKRNI